MQNVRKWNTRASLRADLERLGLRGGDLVMVHAAMRRVGPILGGPDALIGAILDATAPGGTVVAYTDWDASYEDLCDADGRVPEEWRPHVPPFDPQASRAIRDNGVIAEFVRTWPGAVRSASPGPSIAAIGARAEWLAADHPIEYGYGENSPFAKLVAAGGRVLMAGAPLDTMTLLHHAEHLARIPGKRIKRVEVPFATPRGTEWRWIEEFDTGDPIVDGLDDDYFATVVAGFLQGRRGVQGPLGSATATLVNAAEIVPFAVEWLERRCGRAER
jgi:aminoglycoside 3-N-acetyltransferase